MSDEDDDLLTALSRWASAARVQEAAAARNWETWIQREAQEEARLTGVVLDLLESGSDVSVRTTAALVHHGRFVAVGADFAVLATTTGGTTLLNLGAVSTIRARTQRTEAPARRPEAVTMATLAQVLAGVAGERRRVRWSVSGDVEPGRGELLASGVDVVTFLLDGGGGTVHVPIANLAEVTLTGIG